MKRIFALLLMLISSFAHTEELAMAHISTTQTVIERVQVVWMYTLKVRYWADGTKIVLFNLPPNSFVRKQFIRNVLKLSPISYQQSLDKLNNDGTTSPTFEVSNESEMLQRIVKYNGAIGYLSDKSLITSHDGVVHELLIID